jgi:hypothetical protein
MVTVVGKKEDVEAQLLTLEVKNLTISQASFIKNILENIGYKTGVYIEQQ